MGHLGQFGSAVYGKLAQLKITSNAHTAAATGAEHGAVSTATANMIIRRDASGRADIVAPAAADNTTKIPTTAWVQNELGLGGFGTVTNVGTGTGLTGGPITTTGTLSLANTSVVAGAYTFANVTVDAQGRLTAAANGVVATSVFGRTGAVTAATGDYSAFYPTITGGAPNITGNWTISGAWTVSSTMTFSAAPRINSTLQLTERAASLADVATVGQVWVKSATPNELWWTADDGVDRPLSPTQYKFKTADETVTSNPTNQDDNHLVNFDVEPNSTYAVEGMLFVDTIGGGGLSASFVYDVSIATRSYGMMFVSTAGGITADADVSGASMNMSPAAGLRGIVYVSGHVSFGAVSSGKGKLTWSQVSSNASGVTLKIGSWLKFTKLN